MSTILSERQKHYARINRAKDDLHERFLFYGYNIPSLTQFETLIKKHRISDIVSASEIVTHKNMREFFKKEFLDFVLKDIPKVSKQQKMLQLQNTNNNKKSALTTLSEQVSKDVLNTVKNLIFSINWEVRFFGGKEITNPTTQRKQKIPTTLHKIITEIKKAESTSITWEKALHQCDQHIQSSQASWLYETVVGRSKLTHQIYTLLRKKNLAAHVSDGTRQHQQQTKKLKSCPPHLSIFGSNQNSTVETTNTPTKSNTKP